MPITDTIKFKAKIIHRFERISAKNPILYKLIYERSRSTNVIIVGGFLRSIANNETPRDLDVIINTEPSLIESQLLEAELTFKKNRYGGFKISLNTIDVDIWTVKTNWAFQAKLMKANPNHLIEKIAENTFLNYDSLAFDFKTEHIHFAFYNSCAVSKEIDIIKKKPKYSGRNPGGIGNVLRLFSIRIKNKLSFSTHVCDYIVHQLRLNNINENDATIKFLFDYISTNKYSFNSVKLTRDDIQNCYQYVIETASSFKQNSKDQMSLFS